MALSIRDKVRLVGLIARAGVTWLRRNTRYPSPVPDNPKFTTPMEAIRLIGDGTNVAVSGLGANQRASILYWAIRESFEKAGHPRDLTLINVGGHGGRGMAPGTLEELGRDGLCTRFVTSHFEVFHAMLDLATAGRCELQCIPLGPLVLGIDAQGRGETTWTTSTGVGTFIDPRVGSGSHVCDTTENQLVEVAGEELRYHVPAIDVAIFNAPAADRLGNIYVHGCSTVGEAREMAYAARHNGGKVIANVGLIVEEGYDEAFLPASMVDAITYYPETEQAGLIQHRHHWDVFTTESTEPISAGLERVRFLNNLAKVVPQRTEADAAVGRLAATTLLQNVARGGRVNIGTGFGEEVGRIVYEAGHLDEITFLVESGPVGGLPAPGMFFGASLCPERILTSAEMFKLCYERLDATCLGALQVDSQGNVNVSRRGDGPRGYVGPGGFIDLTTTAATIIFLCAWMDHAKFALDGDKMRIAKPGRTKFVEQVDEITFHGQRALAMGKKVFYATHVGLFRLTEGGLALQQVMPGIDIERDVLDRSEARIVLPESGDPQVVEASIVTGVSFELGSAQIPAASPPPT